MALDNPITTTLHYLKLDPKWNDEKPFTLFVDVSDIQGAQNTNIVKEAVPGISVHDARPSLDGNDRLTLDINGFEMIHLRQDDSPDDFENPKWVEDHYYPYLCRLLKGRLGAKEARVYEHKLRYRHPGFGDTRLRGHADYDPPIPQVHADMTPIYGEQIFKDKWPEALDAPRRQVINLWRPLVDRVTEWPLALCDVASVDKHDLRATDQVKRLKGSENSDNSFVQIESYVAHHSENHMWYYLKDQTFEEGWLLKLYDSKLDEPQAVLHTSFDVGEGHVPRRSCEMRVLVKY